MSDDQKAKEKQFKRRLDKAGWYAYKDEETGRVVTNAYPREVKKLSEISGMPCEIVVSQRSMGELALVGPKLEGGA